MGTRKFIKPEGVEIEVNDAPGVSEIAQREGWEEVKPEERKSDGPNATNGAIELAEEAGIDLADVPGFGAEGVRLSKSDVQKYIDDKADD